MFKPKSQGSPELALEVRKNAIFKQLAQTYTMNDHGLDR